MPRRLTKGKVFKIWIDIEEYDIETGEGHLVDCLTIPCTTTVRTEEEADAFAKELNERAKDIPHKTAWHI